MRIAVVGGGVAGLYAAWHLARRHEVILLERNGRVGGHTDTHEIVKVIEVGTYPSGIGTVGGQRAMAMK